MTRASVASWSLSRIWHSAPMRLLWPQTEQRPLSDRALEQLYRFRRGQRWVVTNFVSSLDGGVEVDGKTGGLSDAADHRVFMLGRNLADVVLVGAGTARAETYHGVRHGELDPDMRCRHGLAPFPPIAVVTSGNLPPDSPVITDTNTPTLVITSAACPPQRRAEWTAAGARVLIAGHDHVNLARGLDLLEEQDLRRIYCEGGPQLFTRMLQHRLINELRLTISPMLLGDHAQRITAEALAAPVTCRLASVVAESETLLMRYLLSADDPNTD